MPGPGLSAPEIMEAIHRGEIKALFSMCFNPLVSLPDANFTREALAKLEFFGVIDFFLSETAHHADVVLCGSLQEEDEGVVCSAEGRVQKINKAVDSAGRRASRTALIICDLAKRLGKGQFFAYRVARARSSTSCAMPRRAGIADYYGITYEKIDDELGVFWPCPAIGPSRARRACSRTAGSIHADGKAHFLVTEWRRAAIRVDAEFPISSRPAASSATTSRARRRGASARSSTSTRSRSSRSTRGSPSSTASPTATG